MPIGEVASGRVWACSLRSRLVFRGLEICLERCDSYDNFGC